MLIVDSQVHIGAANSPERPWPARHKPHRPEPFSSNDLLREMDAAGVDAAVIVPPSWEGERNDLGLEAARLHPHRFAVMGRMDIDAPSAISDQRAEVLAQSARHAGAASRIQHAAHVNDAERRSARMAVDRCRTS